MKRGILVFLVWGGIAVAQDRNLRVSVSPALVGTGFLKHLLPRFTLKTQVRIDLVETGADMILDTAGSVPILQRGGVVYYVLC